MIKWLSLESIPRDNTPVLVFIEGKRKYYVLSYCLRQEYRNGKLCVTQSEWRGASTKIVDGDPQYPFVAWAELTPPEGYETQEDEGVQD